ncbi:MAG TPA: hypothetical protein PLR88_00725 [Bacteroidales bacterium]|nr:hypothetical protein [Bacteroidales bacterium]
MEEVKNNTGQNLGIAALITAIITFMLAVIPCLGIIAIIPGIIALVLAIVGMSQASKTNSPRGMLIAGLIIAIVSVMISFSQIFVAGRIAKHHDKWPADIENIINDVQDNVVKGFEDANVSIKVDNNGNKVEITADSDSNKKNLEMKLEDLEGGNSSKNDTSPKKK